ncbi:MAG: hypothetical protein ABDH32_02670 [Candidatus Caldarchaeales archaeon]
MAEISDSNLDMTNLDIRLVCRFYQYTGGWKNLLSTLSRHGWKKIDNMLEKEKFKLEPLAESEDRSEVILSLRDKDGLIDPAGLKDVVRQIVNGGGCWYIDVYYFFRGIDFGEVARKLNLDSRMNEVKRLKIHGVEIVLETYPLFGKLTASYRISSRDVDAVKMIHSKLIEYFMVKEV